MPFASVAGTDVFFGGAEDPAAGLGQVVLLVHGAFDHHDLWRDVVPALARDHTPVAVDLPGHGRSPGPVLDRAEAYRAFLAGLTDALRLPPFVFCGHSMGGLLAQLLAAKGLARAIALLTPARTWGTLPSSEDEIVAAMGLMSTGPFWTQAMDPVFEIAAENSLNCLSPKRRGEIFAQFVPESGQAIFESMFWMFDKNRASYVNPLNVDCPVLAIAGGSDKVTSATSVRDVADKYLEQATYLEFSGMGHMLLLEDNWRAVADACSEWLETI